MKPIKQAILICVLVGAIGSAQSQEAEPEPRKVLRHVVLFSFKKDSPEAKIREIEAAFMELPNKIPGILHMEWGLNNSPEGLNKGLTHCFTLTFDSAEARDAYLPHPEHKAFGDLAGPHIADVLVVDYWAGE